MLSIKLNLTFNPLTPYKINRNKIKENIKRKRRNNIKLNINRKKRKMRTRKKDVLLNVTQNISFNNI